MVFSIIDNSLKFSSMNVRPIFCVIKEVVFGIDTNNEWVKITAAGKTNFEENIYDMSLLTLLEFGYPDLQNCISNSLKTKHVDISLINSFPFSLAVFSGLKNGSEYWIELALKWLEDDNKLQNSETFNLLNTIFVNKKYSQKIRHKIMKISRKY